MPARVRDDSPIIGGQKSREKNTTKVPQKKGFGFQAPRTDLIDKILLETSMTSNNKPSSPNLHRFESQPVLANYQKFES